MDDTIVVLSIRATERIHTDGGRAFTRLNPISKALLEWMIWYRRLQGDSTPSSAFSNELDHARVLPVLRASMDQVLGSARNLRLIAHPQLKLNVPDHRGTFDLRRMLVFASVADSMAAAEGDEMIFALVLRPCEGQAEGVVGSPFCTIGSPIRDPSDVARLVLQLVAPDDAPSLHGLLPASSGKSAFSRSGFYVLSVTKVATPIWTEWRMDPQSDVVIAVVSAYLFRSYLCALRLERAMLGFLPNGDWDEESRRLLLARNRQLCILRFGLMKNRAEPNAPILSFFSEALSKFRLRTLSEDLALVVERSEQLLAARTAYADSIRIRTIEAILFVASVLSLAVGLNAIQMPPFFDPNTKNALHRWEFWLVTVSVAGVFVTMWGALTGWRHTRRLLRWGIRMWKQVGRK